MTLLEVGLCVTLVTCVIWWIVDHFLMKCKLEETAQRLRLSEERLAFKVEELDLWMCNE